MWDSAYCRRRTVEQSYVEAYVALKRINRRADSLRIAYQRWLDRISLAERRGEPALVAAARRRAIRTAELEADLRQIYSRMEHDVEQLRRLVLDP